MRIAMLGATSQLARDLILTFGRDGGAELQLFARRPEAVAAWLAAVGLAGRFSAADFGDFPGGSYDAVVNFVGAGDPARAAAMGAAIFDLTLQFDELALEY